MKGAGPRWTIPAGPDIEPTLTLLEALHARWVGLLRAMSNYAWHGRHHTAQILGLAD